MVKMTPVNKLWLLNISHLYKVHMASHATNRHCARGRTALHTWCLCMKTRDSGMKLTYIIALRQLKALSLRILWKYKNILKTWGHKIMLILLSRLTQYISCYQHIQQTNCIIWAKYTNCWHFLLLVISQVLITNIYMYYFISISLWELWYWSNYWMILWWHIRSKSPLKLIHDAKKYRVHTEER